MSDSRSPVKGGLASAQPFFADLTPIDLSQVIPSSASSKGGLGSAKTPANAPKMPSQDEIAAIRAVAQAAGYKEGFAQGHSAGMLQAVQDVEAQNASFVSLLSSFRAALDHQAEVLPQQVLKLSLEIAQAMLCVQIEARPKLLIPVIKEAICKLPNLTNPLHIVVNPGDAGMVRKHMHDTLHENGWIVVEDPRMSRGGCVIDSPINSIDATLENRWKRLCEALGQQGEWIEMPPYHDA